MAATVGNAEDPIRAAYQDVTDATRGWEFGQAEC